MNSFPSAKGHPIPLERIEKFVRQLTHDVRNGLSAMDLEAAFITEIATGKQVTAELRRLRAMIADTAQMLRRISQQFQPPVVHPLPWKASELMEELGQRLQTDLTQAHPEFAEELEAVEVENRFKGQTVEADLEQTVAILATLLRNTFQFRWDGEAEKEEEKTMPPVKLVGQMKNGMAVIEVHAPFCAPKGKAKNVALPPQQWGREPLLSTRSGGYGLELFHARQVAEAQGGALELKKYRGTLVAQVTLRKGEG